MSFGSIVARLLPRKLRDRVAPPPSPSMVLLLREANWPSADVFRLAAERAWGISISGTDESPHFIMHSEEKTVMRAAPHMFTIFGAARPYLDGDPVEHAKLFPLPSQQQAWREHTAWIAINCIDGSGDVELEYCVLAKFAAEMLNANCTGIWVPAESSLAPRDEALYGDLQKLATSRDPGIAH
jgi:hypothetical protein